MPRPWIIHSADTVTCTPGFNRCYYCSSRGVARSIVKKHQREYNEFDVIVLCFKHLPMFKEINRVYEDNNVPYPLLNKHRNRVRSVVWRTQHESM